MHSQSALSFVGFIAEPKVHSWYETTLQLLFQDCKWCELQLFIFCLQQRFLFSASEVSYCFCVIRTMCPIKVRSPGHFVPLGAKKMCNTVFWLAGQGCSQHKLHNCAARGYFQIHIPFNFWKLPSSYLNLTYCHCLGYILMKIKPFTANSPCKCQNTKHILLPQST